MPIRTCLKIVSGCKGLASRHTASPKGKSFSTQRCSRPQKPEAFWGPLCASGRFPLYSLRVKFTAAISSLFRFRTGFETGSGKSEILTRDGDTLVEVLIAMVLFLFIFMAVLSTALLAIDSNTRNMLRNEAGSIASQSMSGARSHTFATLPNAAGNFHMTRNFRNFEETYSVTNAVMPLDQNPNNHDLVTVTVTWNWKGQQQPKYVIQSVVGQ